jgi:hypothetical protein
MMIIHCPVLVVGIAQLGSAYKSRRKPDRRIIILFKFQRQRNIFSKASNTMSAVPSFSFATTAEEVAAVFSQEIRGKNGTCVPCLAMKNELIKFASHRHGYISERDWF